MRCIELEGRREHVRAHFSARALIILCGGIDKADLLLMRWRLALSSSAVWSLVGWHLFGVEIHSNDATVPVYTISEQLSLRIAYTADLRTSNGAAFSGERAYIACPPTEKKTVKAY